MRLITDIEIKKINAKLKISEKEKAALRKWLKVNTGGMKRKK